ncbi:hypothetical protein EP10_003068 [Geobacillus icigianus]|uniref:Uncharacterized protein n=1 Tax=Geobacillus icigianus TaxID=1430331 RepID=A0ABU6BJK5_9BACL|nr:hypothetical protein [Geobacillus icigianus]
MFRDLDYRLIIQVSSVIFAVSFIIGFLIGYFF